jgi:PEP-CTERM motif
MVRNYSEVFMKRFGMMYLLAMAIGLLAQPVSAQRTPTVSPTPVTRPVSVPEPSSLLLLGSGVLALWGAVRWRRKT